MEFLKCSKCKTLKNPEGFHSNLSRKTGRDALCKKCRRLTNDVQYARRVEYKRKWDLKRQRARQKQLRKIAVGSTCPVCKGLIRRGQKYCFHHRQPWTKRFTMGQGSRSANDVWELELAKCDVMHRGCHNNIHNVMRKRAVDPLPDVIDYIKETIGGQ